MDIRKRSRPVMRIGNIRKRLGNERGSALLMALGITAALALIGAVSAVTSTTEHKAVSAVRRAGDGLYSAESCLVWTEHSLRGKWHSELTAMTGDVTTARSALAWDAWGSWSQLPESDGSYRAYVNGNENLAVIEVLPEGAQMSRGRTGLSPFDESWGATKVFLRSVGTGDASSTSIRVNLEALALSIKKLP